MKLYIEQACNGDMEAFAHIVKAFENRIYNLALYMLRNTDDAEEVTQEIFLKIYMNLKFYQENSQFSTWVFRIASNACLDRIRKVKQERKRILELSAAEMIHKELSMTSKNNPEDIVEHRELIRYINKAIDDLPVKYRMIILLNIQQKFSYQEIAEVMDIPVRTVGTQLHRAKSLLRKKLAPMLKGWEYDGFQTALLQRSPHA